MTASRLRRAARGLRYVRCACGEMAYSEAAHAQFWSTAPEGGRVYLECACGRHHEITRHKPVGAGWRRPLLTYRELPGMPEWATQVRKQEAELWPREWQEPAVWL